MALWNVEHLSVKSHPFPSVIPVEVLAEFDALLTFTFRDARGDLLLANLCAVGRDVSRYLACATTEQMISDMKRGAVSMRTALTIEPLWLLDVRADGSVSQVWQTTVAQLPEGALPEAGVLLFEESDQL